MNSPRLPIDRARLWSAIEQMASISPGIAGGSNRQALTHGDGLARNLLARWCEQAGLSVSVDGVGNMFAFRAGTDPSLAPVLFGSHLDTQPTGGRFDGVLGVLAALEGVRAMNDAAIRTRHPVAIVNWTAEEGSRFVPSMLGSGAFAGVYEPRFALGLADAEGLRFGDELDRIGYGGKPMMRFALRSYYELHIEQGPILEAEDVPIGIVTHGFGLRWLEASFTGPGGHAGTTPLDRRRDPMRGLAGALALADDLNGMDRLLATLAHVEVTPNVANVIPARVLLTLDLRSADSATLARGEAEARAGLARIAAACGLELSLSVSEAYEPVAFDPAATETLRKAATRLGYPCRDMISGAGHDAFWLAGVAPTGLLFCPCVDGVSHAERENVKPEWAEAAASVLAMAVLEDAVVEE